MSTGAISRASDNAPKTEKVKKPPIKYIKLDVGGNLQTSTTNAEDVQLEETSLFLNTLISPHRNFIPHDQNYPPFHVCYAFKRDSDVNVESEVIECRKTPPPTLYIYKRFSDGWKGSLARELEIFSILRSHVLKMKTIFRGLVWREGEVVGLLTEFERGTSWLYLQAFFQDTRWETPSGLTPLHARMRWLAVYKVSNQIIEAIRYLHKLGIVHGSLSPHCIEIRSFRFKGEGQRKGNLLDAISSIRAVVADFSASTHHIGWAAPELKQIMETSEEQTITVTQDPFTKAMDVYSLGAVLWTISKGEWKGYCPGDDEYSKRWRYLEGH
ncbi:hypothetical protein DFH11DRAFT_1748135 [Phellopilus nigrolimitatus]|nr:hypothetical protein DFH11DRAFT_1748135 [Phellopilus nigrolimitatus]